MKPQRSEDQMLPYSKARRFQEAVIRSTHHKMSLASRIWTVGWRTLLIGLGYLLALLVAGGLDTALGWPLPAGRGNALTLSLIGGVCIGLTLALIAWPATFPRRRLFVIGVCAVFFTMASTTIEGAFFAPALVGSVPGLVLLDAVAALIVGALTMVGLAPRYDEPKAAEHPAPRPWFSWAWRFLASAASYVVFYGIYGALNYQLVTQPYYTAHHTVLTVPPLQWVYAAESARAPLLVLAVLPLVLTANLTRRQLGLDCAAVLFIIGGVVPLLQQVRALPTFLLLASGWEIFFQNVSLALVITWLLGRK